MEDDDWETADLTIPISNETQTKQLEIRKLVEESDNKLTDDLFNEKKEYIEELTPKPNKTPNKPPKQHKNVPPVVQIQSHAKEEKKNEKRKQKKAREIYGEAEYDAEFEEYLDYEDKILG